MILVHSSEPESTLTCGTSLLASLPQSQGGLNSLYSGRKAHDFFIDDDLPDIHDLLRPYATPSTATTDFVTASSARGSDIVRASTFDGKAHFIGRRTRRSQRSTTVR